MSITKQIRAKLKFYGVSEQKALDKTLAYLLKNGYITDDLFSTCKTDDETLLNLFDMFFKKFRLEAFEQMKDEYVVNHMRKKAKATA